MTPGYLFWGTGDGFSSNLLGNRTTNVTIDLRAWDDKFRHVKTRNGISLTEVYYAVFEHETYLFVTAIDPTFKDSIDRPGFLACSVFFRRDHSLKGSVLEVLNYLIRSYRDKRAANSILTSSECESKVSYLNLEPKPSLGSGTYSGVYVSQCASNDDLNLVLSNSILGFDAKLSYLFLSDVAGIKTLPSDCQVLSLLDVMSIHKQLKLRTGFDETDRMKQEQEAHLELQKILIFGQKGNLDAASAMLKRYVSANNQVARLLEYPEYSTLKYWYNDALRKGGNEDNEIIEEIFNSAYRMYKKGNLHDALEILDKIPFNPRGQNSRVKGLRNSIERDLNRSSFFNKLLFGGLLVVALMAVGTGLYYFKNDQVNEIVNVDSQDSVAAETRKLKASTPLSELKNEWQTKKSVDIKALIKALHINDSDYFDFDGKLIWSKEAQYFLLKHDSIEQHLDFRLNDKIALCNDSIQGIFKYPFVSVKNQAMSEKGVLFVGNNKYRIMLDKMSKTVQYITLGNAFNPDGKPHKLADYPKLIQKDEVKYLYTQLGIDQPKKDSQTKPDPQKTMPKAKDRLKK